MADTKKTADKPLKVAIVHDWLVGGGAELVVEQLHILYPNAPIYTSYATDEWRKRLNGKVRTGFLQHLGKLRKFVPFLRIWWFTHLNFAGYDLVISSSGAEAKGIKVPKGTIHINYCHAPTHYYWTRYDEYMQHPGFGRFDRLARLGLKLLVSPLRRWDYKAAQRPHHIIANSTYIARAIEKYYNREATVIFPPIDVEQFANSQKQARDGLVIVGRQTPYKRVDLAVTACTQLNKTLTVIGRGPDHDRLVAMAGPSITFRTDADDAEKARIVQSSQAFLFPVIDDFGISAVEALAAGTPLVAYKGGGALDYVEDGVNGLFFDDQTAEGLAAAIRRLPHYTFDNKAIMQSTKRFAPAVFRQRMHDYIATIIS
jgi:glycosyltransferase involved in cell wall biosynthesis